jgi:hypothetical protein
MLERYEKIQTRAYALWEKMGYPHGADWDHWFEAERQIDRELPKGFTAKKAPAKANVKKAGKAA